MFRMSETSGREAKTIHRLLEFDPASGGFKRDREKSLDGDVFVIQRSRWSTWCWRIN